MSGDDDISEFVKLSWPRAPVHRLSQAGTFMVTTGTYRKAHHFRGRDRLAVLQRGLLNLAERFGWRLEAWAVFSNHYHFVGHSPSGEDTAESLSTMLGQLHEKTAKWINKLDGAPKRQVWHNFRETSLTFEKSYLARLGYTHRNPVKHGLVPVADRYPWCSAGWFQRTATRAQVNTLYRFPIDKVKVFDDFDPSPDW